ncbi:hypothetical protein HaLaN_32989, partial [Haematococcus lacustris]
MVDKKRGAKAKCANALKASEAEARLHQMQTDLKHKEQQVVDKERLQQLQQQQLQRKEQQLAVLV